MCDRNVAPTHVKKSFENISGSRVKPGKTTVLSFLFGIALLLLTAVNAGAVETFTPAETMDGVFIGKYVEHFIDPTKQLTLADMHRDSVEAQFIPVNRDTLDFGLSNAAHWIRLSVNNPSREHISWILQAEHPLLNHIEVYEIALDGKAAFHEGGTQIPFSRRDIAYRKSAFSMDSPPGASEIYIKVWPDTLRIVANCTLTAWGTNRFIAKNSVDTLLLGLYYGALLVMCLYNLFIYFSVRDTTYLLYVSYIVFAGLTYFVANGLVFQYLWAASPLAGLGLAMYSFVFAILFSRSFLNTRKAMPKIDKALLALAVVYAVNGLLMFTMPAAFAFAITAGYFSGMALTPLLLYAGIRSLGSGSRPARYYTVAWTVYLAGVMLYFLKDFGILPYSFMTAYSMQIGTLADVILLSLALAERIKILREEKETAQTRIIEHEQRALKIAEEARATLEREVAERTAQVEEALGRLQKIASRVPGIVYQFRMRPDGGTSIPYASDAARAIYRLDPGEVRGDASKTFDCVHPDDVDAYVASIQASARDLTPWIHEYRLKFGDEPDIWLLGNAMPQREADGSTLWHGFITDITERKRVEEARRKSEERWKFAVEGSRAGVFDWNIQTGESECSERWKEIYGIEGKTFEECVSRTHPEDQAGAIASLQAHFDGKTPAAEHEFRIMDGHGGWKWTIGRGLVVSRDADGKPLRVVGTITDITERKRADIELRQAKEQAENATRLKDKFVSLVSHDLRGPLASLAVGLEMLLKSGDLSPADQLFVGKMARHSRELLGLTERLLDLSRLQAGKITPRKRFINCRGFAAAQAGLFQNMAAQKEIAIVNNLPETMKVYADPDFFGECVKNLLSNAIKFCGKGDTITIFNPPDMPSTIAVKDDGPGIKPEKMASLFVAGLKKRTIGTAGEKGTGIGLAHTKELMEASGGGIAVESAPGKGSTFLLVFPHSFNITVLVVDDQEVVRAAIREHCAGIFPGILEAGNGEEALAVIKTVTPHLIITDINMPVMDGLEFIRQVRSDGMARHVPIIAMTSDEARFAPNGMDIRSYCLHIGADDFVNKPVAANDLIPRVSRLLQDARV